MEPFMKSVIVLPNFTPKLGALSRKCVCSSIPISHIAQRKFSQSSVALSIGGDSTGGNYTKGPEIKDVLQKLIKNPKLMVEGARGVRDQFTMFKNEFKEYFSPKYYSRDKGEIDMFFTFENDESISKFVLTTDSSHNAGSSTANFVRTQNDSGLFYGNIVTTPPRDGKTHYAGFATILSKRPIKSFYRASAHNLLEYTHLVMKVRGDGRNYMVLLSAPGLFDLSWQDQYQFPLYTRGGPYWQLVKIPFSDFFLTSKGSMQDLQNTAPMNEIARFGFTLADRIDGPFKLEIDYIGLEFQPFHKSICPYEHYDTGDTIMNG